MCFYHPVTLLAVQNVMTIITIAYTQPYHPIRLAILLFILAYTYLLFPTFLHKLEHRALASILCGTIFANILSYVDRVLLSQWSFENGGPVSPSDLQTKQVSSRNKIIGVAQDQAISPTQSESLSVNTFNGTLWQRLQYGYFISSAARLIGTPHQVKNVPAYWTSDPSRTPSPVEFLLRKLLIFCVCYFVLDVATSSADPVHNRVLYDVAKIPLFSRWAAVDSEELIRKTVGGVGYWTASYCTIQCYMGMWAFMCVACGDEPQYWRPNFGSLTEGCTLRGFWG